MIKDFMTAYWGLLPTTSKPYPASGKVNAFVGPSGHGKTTIWDGLRVVLGDITFESRRKVENYVHPKSNWAIVRVSFYNTLVDGKRPFESHGYYEEEVVVCCRIYKNNEGKWNKEYYVFDGEFVDILDLASNHKSYKQKLKLQEEYKKILEDCLGITPAFKKLMAMNPESVRDMVKYTPNDLFKKIFELKGIKEVQEKYRRAKETLGKLEIDCESAEKELKEARNKFDDYKDKVHKYNRFKDNEKQYNSITLRMKKLEFYEHTNEIEDFIKQIFEKEQTIEKEKENLIKMQTKLESLRHELNNIDIKDENLKRQFSYYINKIDEINPIIAELERDTDDLKKKINSLCSLEKKDIGELKERLKEVSKQRKASEFNFNNAKVMLEGYNRKQIELKANRPVYPPYVFEFLKKLSQLEIEHLMLADAINIKPEYRKWQKAVESYIGSNRYRIIVNSKQYVGTKKLQETCKYTARVCLPKACDVKILRRQNDLLSIWDVIEVLYPDKTGGYLNGLQNIYLVDTVEDGHKLQQKGLVSITREGLLQDNDGSIFRNYGSLCCGKLAILVETEQVEIDIKRAEQEVQELNTQTITLEQHEKNLENEVEEMIELENLSKYKEELKGLIEKFNVNQSELDDLKSKRDGTSSDRDILNEEKVKNARELTRLEGDIKAQESLILTCAGSIVSINGQIDLKEKEMEEIKLQLFSRGIKEEDLIFIEDDVKTPQYLDEEGEIFKSTALKTQCINLSREINDFKHFHPEINDKIITLYNVQNSRVEEMNINLQELKHRRDEWNDECINSLEDLRHHIKITIKEYIQEFQKLAELLKASAGGRLEERGEDPEYWELYLYIGFDGKKATLIDGPELSSGQKACTSLMLLLAAINDRKEGVRVPIMFLDEPKSRLDDSRGNEVGALLQLTDIQYFITHQQGESLKYIDWINHCFSVSVCKVDEQFAPPIMFQRMRTA